MEKFKVIGEKTRAVSFAKVGDILLHPGEVVELPADNPHVRTLVAIKYLEKVTEEAPAPVIVPEAPAAIEEITDNSQSHKHKSRQK